MGARVVLRQSSLSVDPGAEASCEVEVQNTGNVVDEFTIEVVGTASSWFTAEPPTVSLMPAGQEVVRVRFTPPRTSSVPSGAVAFGVKVSSREDPAGSATEEGTLEVGSFVDLDAEITPRTAQTRFASEHEIAIDNRGNAPASVKIEPVDSDRKLSFDIDPPVLECAPGTASFAQLKARPRKKFLRGPAKTLPFNVNCTSDGSPPLAIDGAVVQEALIPKWVPIALGALLAAVLAWLFLLQPSIETTLENAAQDAAKDEVKDVVAGPIEEVRDAIKDVAATAGAKKPDFEEDLPKDIAGLESISAESFKGLRFDRRLSLTASRGGTQTAHKVGEGRTLSVTDLIFQNPNGAEGILDIRRNGDILIRVRLENFRDLDYHFVTPLVFKEGEELRAWASCSGGSRCSVAVFVTGFVQVAE